MEKNNFNFVDLSQNDNFYDMDGSDLQELFFQINKYILTLREVLGFNPDITFGLELEFEDIKKREELKEKFESNISKMWDMGYDGSLTRGAEIRSPILRDTKDAWEALDKVCLIASSYGNVGKHSAGHVHIGTQTIGSKKQAWLNFLKLWGVYENIIYRFVYGEFLTKLSGIRYCDFSREVFLRDYLYLKDRYGFNAAQIANFAAHERAQAVNFNNVNSNIKSMGKEADRNTIEFRCPNGTLNPVVWQNNVNLFVRLLLYSKDLSKYDDDTIEKRRLNIPENLYYDEIYLDQALELCDLIFTDNLSKIYFMKQYLKGFEISNKEMRRAREFTDFGKK